MIIYDYVDSHSPMFDKMYAKPSPAISGSKVYELIDLLREKQASGVEVTIVTWTPDLYGYGDTTFWM